MHKFGLTSGDVTADLDRLVWANCRVAYNSLNHSRHSLSGGAVDKTEWRMTVEVPVDHRLVKYNDWAKDNVKEATREWLIAAGGQNVRLW